MELHLVVRQKHTAKVEVTYEEGQYTIRHLESSNLLYDAQTGAIHRNYNAWVRELVVAFNAALGGQFANQAGWPTPTKRASTAEVPPLSATAEGMPTPGTRWRYKYRDEQFKSREHIFTIEVIGVEGSQVQERFIVDGGEISQTVIDGDRIRFMARTVAGTNQVLELAPYGTALYRKPAISPSGYPSHAAVGSVWQIGKPAYADDLVTVPAGSFAALRVEIGGTLPAYGLGTNTYSQPARFTYTAWYAPEVRRYVKVRHQFWSPTGAPLGDEVVQLVGYQSGK